MIAEDPYVPPEQAERAKVAGDYNAKRIWISITLFAALAPVLTECSIRAFHLSVSLYFASLFVTVGLPVVYLRGKDRLLGSMLCVVVFVQWTVLVAVFSSVIDSFFMEMERLMPR